MCLPAGPRWPGGPTLPCPLAPFIPIGPASPMWELTQGYLYYLQGAMCCTASNNNTTNRQIANNKYNTEITLFKLVTRRQGVFKSIGPALWQVVSAAGQKQGELFGQ